jgi:hypothetical protein
MQDMKSGRMRGSMGGRMGSRFGGRMGGRIKSRISLINLRDIPLSSMVIDFTIRIVFLTSILSLFRKHNYSHVEPKFYAE